MLDAMRDHASTPNGALVGRVALPVCQAVLLHAEGDHAGAVAAMRPVLGEMYRLGGSHAQQDVLEQRDFDGVLSLYDTRFRNLASPVTQQQPDLYIDVQNAASMLFRLSLHGIAGGDRWTELADKAEARIGDCLSAFTLPHWMMAVSYTHLRAHET